MKTKESFNVKHIFFATVPPYDNLKKNRNKLLKYRVIAPSGTTSNYLFDIFDNSTSDCKVEIKFKSDDNQWNEVRDLMLGIVLTNDIKKKSKCFQELTTRMYRITDDRNGMGLFVLIEGKKGRETRLMLCRFKGSQGLHNEGDDLKYISQVFTRQSNHYKLAVFQDIPSKKSFWKGYAIDRQTASTNYKPFSYFWIESFLEAETAITNAQGTAQFSKILKNVLNGSLSLEEKQQIISGIINVQSKSSGNISIDSFVKQYLTGPLANKFLEETNNDEFFHSEFGIDNEVFAKELGSTVLALEDGVTAFVPTFNYKKHVKEHHSERGRQKITIEGYLKDKRINVRRQEKKGVQNKKLKK